MNSFIQVVPQVTQVPPEVREGWAQLGFPTHQVENSCALAPTGLGQTRLDCSPQGLGSDTPAVGQVALS